MKKILASLLVAAMVLAAPLTAFASGFTPSAENKAAPTVEDVSVDGASAELTEGLAGGTIHLEALGLKDMANAPAEVKENMAAAQEEIKAADTPEALEELFPGLQEALEGADLSTVKVTNLFDLSFMKGDEVVDAKDAKVKVQLTLSSLGIADGASYVIYHNEATGKWVLVDVKDLGDDIIELTLNGLSPIAVLSTVEPEEPVPGDEPGTGDEPGAEDKPGAEEPGVDEETKGDTTINGEVVGSGNVATGIEEDTQNTTAILLVCGAALAVAGVVFVAKAKKNVAK